MAYLIGFGLTLPVALVSGSTTVFETALGLACALPLGAVISVGLFILVAAISQFIARAIGGIGTYASLANVLAAALAPITILIALASVTTIAEPLGFLLAVYGIVLDVIAVKAVHQFGWAKAIASNLHTILVATLIPVVAGGYLLSLATRQARDEDYARLADALNARWGEDDTIPTASFGFDTERGGAGGTAQWLVIEVSFTRDCSSTPADPCERLANELAGIVLESYGKVDELGGIRVIIGSEPHELFVEPEDIVFQKALTVAAWRDELD
jgi:hypothetical protein